MPRRLQLLVLTEDTGKHGWQTARCIVRKLLQTIEPTGPLWRDESDAHEWIDPKSERALSAMGANMWRCATREHIEPERALRRAIVTRMLEHESAEGVRQPVGFVFFHHDGDAPWSEHPTCTTCTQFRAFLTRLEQMVRAHLERTRDRYDGNVDVAVARTLSRLFAMEPHWSIEAWLYARSARAATICREQHGGKHHREEALWTLDHAAVEEYRKPKETCCLHDAWNLELAKGFDAREAGEKSPSFSAVARKVRENVELQRALEDVRASSERTAHR
jgi:hypothetical protein